MASISGLKFNTPTHPLISPTIISITSPIVLKNSQLVARKPRLPSQSNSPSGSTTSSTTPALRITKNRAPKLPLHSFPTPLSPKVSPTLFSQLNTATPRPHSTLNFSAISTSASSAVVLKPTNNTPPRSDKNTHGFLKRTIAKVA